MVLRLFLCFLFIKSISYGQFQPLQSYIPKGFTLMDTASGYLNKDGYRDLVMILKNDLENEVGDTSRPLLLLEGSKDGQYRLFARNDNVVLCKECGGVFGDPYDGITIKKGFFSIAHYGGSSWRWSRIITFKFNKEKNQFILSRDAGVSYHSSNPNKITTELYNKKDFHRVTFLQYTNTE
ncbi:MAG: hypothetical protein JNK08_10015 [Sediminibacterium sp.]|nr:hypothetical protein [Sediminibacterium sp.]